MHLLFLVEIFLCLFNFIGGTIKYRQRLGRDKNLKTKLLDIANK